jgi:hypothetical protein
MHRARTFVAFFVLLAAISLLGLAPPFVRFSGRPARRAREDKLAGLRPGQDSLQKTLRILGPNPDQTLSSREIAWWDACNNERALVTFDLTNTVQSVLVDRIPISIDADCEVKGYSRSKRAKFGSGRGLLKRDRCERVEEIYGQPDIKKASESHRELYSYNYRGASDKPTLTLEITCDTGVGQVSSLKLAVSAK